MFQAMVLACAMGAVTPDTCIEATDNLGPYKTREQCMERVEEMVQVLAYTIPTPMEFRFKCETVKGVSL